MVNSIYQGPCFEMSNGDMAARRLRRACTEFESLFVAQMLKSMRRTVVEDGLLGNSHESRIVKSMYDENLALALARGGGIGLGQMLFERLRVRNPTLY